MTTFEAAAVGLLRRTTASIEKRAQRKAQRANTAKTIATLSGRARRAVLTVGALGSFTYAAATWREWAGFVVGGLCALYLEQSMSDD